MRHSRIEDSVPVLDEASAQLLRSVIGPNSPAGDREFEDNLRNVRAWEPVLHWGNHHRVLPLLYLRAKERNAVLPEPVEEELREAYEGNVAYSLLNASELLQLLKEFEAVGVPILPFKGVVLAAELYGDVAARPAGDLDLLIFHRDLEIATQILKARGFELKPGRLEVEPEDIVEHAFIRVREGIVVELRWRLDLTHPNPSKVQLGQDLGMDWLWPPRRTVNLAGMAVPHLTPERELIMLCMHGSKHTWSRLIWVADVARILEKVQLDWEALLKEAKRLGLRNAVGLGLLLAQRVAGAPLPEPVLVQFTRNKEISELAGFLERNLVIAPGRRPAGGLPYNVRLLEKRDRLRLLGSTASFRPNELDRAVVKLPEPFEWLYYVVRPLRLLYERASRSADRTGQRP